MITQEDPMRRLRFIKLLACLFVIAENILMSVIEGEEPLVDLPLPLHWRIHDVDVEVFAVYDDNGCVLGQWVK